MKVTLIDYTGNGTTDPMWYAAKKLLLAKNTRLSKEGRAEYIRKLDSLGGQELIKELEAIVLSIRSSWEFVSYTFLVDDISRATCDQMTRSRVGVAFAVQTQRMINHSQFEYAIPESVKRNGFEEAFIRHMEVVSSFYETMTQRGVPPQDARSVLPMATYSPVMAEYNLRSLSGLIGKRTSLRTQGEYIEVAKEMKRLAIGVHPWAEMFLSPERTRTPDLDAVMRSLVGVTAPAADPQLTNALKQIDQLKAVWD
jgi:thymidylate synthase (FAD)